MKNLALFAALAWLAVFPARGFDQTYWVWQRTQPLQSGETRDLHAAGVTRLYWHAGTIKWDGAAWHWIEHLRLDWAALRASCPGVELVPVLRIEAGKVETFPAPSRALLAQILNQLVAQAGAHALEIDYESPDRLMGEYADFLRQLKDQGRPWRLSISALGHWSRFAPQLAAGADEITPMFYDLDPRLERLGPAGLPPLVEPAMAEQMAAWRGCPVPWRAGLPNFSRVTVIDLTGKSRGNVRSWSWNDLLFAPQLQTLGSTADGQTVFTVARDFVLGQTPLKAQEHLDVRYPDRDQLAQAQAAATADGAQGVIYFRLADSGDPSGYSVRDLAAANAEAPSLSLARDAEGRFVLTNRGARDLMPVASGYALEIESATPIWREEVAGDFAKVTSDDAGATGLGAAHLQFWFAHLPSGNSLTTGYIGEAVHDQSGPLRWRIQNLEKENVWHPLD